MKKIGIIIFCLMIVNIVYGQRIQVIDNFSSIINWYIQPNGIYSSAMIPGPNNVGNGLEVNYALNSSSTYLQIYKQYLNLQDMGAFYGDSLLIPVKASVNCIFKLFLFDNQTPIPVSFAYPWTLSPSTTFTNLVFYLTNVPKSFLKNSVASIKLEVDPIAGTKSGSVQIGPINLQQSTSITAASNGFNIGNSNPKANGGTIHISTPGSNYVNAQCTSVNGDTYINCNTNTNNVDISKEKYLSLKIRPHSGDPGGEQMAVQLNSMVSGSWVSGGRTSFTVPSSYTWTTYQIPLSSLESGSFDPTAVREVDFFFLSPANVDIQGVSFYIGSTTAGIVRTIDPMTVPFNVSSWNTGYDGSPSLLGKGNSYINPSIVKSSTTYGDVTELDFNFFDGQYVYINRTFGLNFFNLNTLSFDFMGNGANNNLEIKFQDENGVVYEKRLYQFTDTQGVWKHVQIKTPDDLYILSGSGNNNNLDLKNISTLYFTPSMPQTGGGKNGTFAIANLAMGDFVNTVQTSGSIIQNFQIIPNPFSPGKTGGQDQVFFTFQLTKQSKITLYVYDLKGNQLLSQNESTFSAGVPNTIQWDGKDHSGNILKNGLYIVKFYAQATDNSTDNIKSVLSVLK